MGRHFRTIRPMPGSPEDDSKVANAYEFRTTHWSVVLRAGSAPAEAQETALERLCQAYWLPVYAFIRRKGQPVEDARDLTQAFFARVLEKGYLRAVDASKGKFRTFLLTALTRFLANEWDRAQTLKRGGGWTSISLDAQSAEERCHFEPVDDLSPDKVFDRAWANQILERVMTRLEEEYTADGHQNRFEVLRTFLVEDKGALSYAEAASRMKTTENTVRMGIYRMRLRYGELLRQEIAQTVSSESEIDAEITHLLESL